MIKKLTSKIVYKNPWLQLREDKVQFPNGIEGTYAYVDRQAVGPLIIPFTTDERLVLLREWRYPIQTWTYNFPHGAADTGETMLTAAKRELLEETGMTAEVWTDLGKLQIDPGANNQEIDVFLAERATVVGAPEHEESEIIEIKTFSLEEIEQGIVDGTFTNGWTLAALAKLLVRSPIIGL